MYPPLLPDILFKYDDISFKLRFWVGVTKSHTLN